MTDFGILSVLPPLVAIGLALFTETVLYALFAGVWVGGLMVAGGNPVAGTVTTIDWYVGSVTNPWNMKILLCIFLIGSAIGIVYKSGSAHAFVGKLMGRVRSSRAAALTSTAFGVLMFIDDYANCAVVGSAMQSLQERMRNSREFFSYILDSTAGPVSGFAIISTWIGFELGLIRDAFNNLNIEMGAYSAWISTLPYRFYAILALILVFIVAYTHMHYGGMYDAEKRAKEEGKVMADDATPMATRESDLGKPKEEKGSPHTFIWSIVALVGVAFLSLWITGGGGEVYQEGGLMGVIGNAASALSLLYAAFAMFIVAFGITLAERKISVDGLQDATVNGMKQMLMANAILVSAWTIGTAASKVGLASYIVSGAQAAGLPAVAVPIVIFFASAFICFSIGSSWATYGIMMPMAIPLAYETAGGLGPVVWAATAAVFTGGIFGSHCSPISDTTILSSTFAECDHMHHVKTQMPYALTVLGITGFLYLIFLLGVTSWMILLPLGVVTLIIAHRVLTSRYGGKVPIYRIDKEEPSEVSTKTS